MNSAKARAFTKYIEGSLDDTEKLKKYLKYINCKIIDDNCSLEIFRSQGLTRLMFKVINSNKDESVHKCVFTLLTTCLLENDFRREVYLYEKGIITIFDIFKTSTCKNLKARICKVIGQQCSHEESRIYFQSLNSVYYIMLFLKESDSDEGRETALKTLRWLAHNEHEQHAIFKNDGLIIICDKGLSSSNPKISGASLKLIYQIHKSMNSRHMHKLLKSTFSLKYFTKLYDEGNDEDKRMVLDILLSLFWKHISSTTSQEYKQNCWVLDELCMAKLPFMIITELENRAHKTKLDKKESNLVLALSKFLELDKYWKHFSHNVLPSYHKRVWMQLTDDFNGIPLLISLISSQRDNLTLLQALFRGLLGLEYLHFSRVKVLYYCVKAKLVPIIADLFDTALKEIEHNSSSSTTTEAANISDNVCYHYVTDVKTEKMKSFSSEISKELLNFGSDNDISSSFPMCPSSLSVSPPISTASYKTINDIKFRTGKKEKDAREEDRKRCCYDSPSRSPKNQEAHLSSFVTDSFTVIGERKDKFEKNGTVIDNKVFEWMNILESIIRLVYQIILVTNDISSLCRQFLLKVFHYISKSRVVHSSALKLLEAVAKNSTSIQHVLDIMFIPKLSVDLKENLQENCAQCILIQDGIKKYIFECRSFFNHHHQYGRCEVSNRLNPSKPDIIRHSCIVAFTQVATCPSILSTFFLHHKALETLLQMFEQPESDQLRMHLYAVAALSIISFNLKTEFDYKLSKISCFFCIGNISSIILTSEDHKSRKKQIIYLTSLTDMYKHATSNCKIREEKDKNFTFKVNGKVLKVNKEILASKSEVFRAMFQGAFTESCANCITFEDEIEFGAMEMIIHFMYGCMCNIFFNEDVNIYIELLHLSDMYLIPELQVLAIHYISELLEADNVFPFMERIINYLNKDLIQHLICSLLQQPINVQSKEKWFSLCLNSSFKDTFIAHVLEGFTRLLDTTSELCNCNIFFKYS